MKLPHIFIDKMIFLRRKARSALPPCGHPGLGVSQAIKKISGE
jgi:hypothetical protein